MKRITVFLLSLMLLFCIGCGKEEPVPTEIIPETTVPEATVPDTTEATVPGPEVVYGTAEINGVPAVLTTLSRGDTVDVAGSFDETHVVVKTERGYGLVEQNLIRMDSEPEYEPWTGFAANKSSVYDTYRITGEALQTLQFNEQVEVLDNLGHCYFVRCKDITGFIPSEAVSRTRRSSGSTDTDSGVNSGADGGDIHLQFYSGIQLLSVATPQEGAVSGRATVLADGTEVLLGYFDHGDSIPVVTEDGFSEKKDGFHTVYLEDLYAYVPEELVRMADQEAYAAWDGFSKYNAVIYEDRWLLGSASGKLNTNTVVHVLYELDNCYFVEAEGMTGFLAKESVSDQRIVTDRTDSGGDNTPKWSPPIL